MNLVALRPLPAPSDSELDFAFDHDRGGREDFLQLRRAAFEVDVSIVR